MSGSLGENRFSALLENAQDIIIVVDAGGTVTYVNPAIERILGFTPEEMIGENAFEFMHPEDREQVQKRFTELIESPGQATERVRHRLEHASGGWRWVESIGSNHTHEALDGYVINSRDVTDLKRREREIARQRTLLEAQQESVLDGLLVVDETGDIVSYNERFVELSGIPTEILDRGDEEEALDRASEILTDSDEFRATVEHLYENPMETAREEIELEDGRVFDTYTSPLVGEDGAHFGRLWTFRDITARIEHEAELRRNNERLEEFASIVAHDLRNPLNVATGRLELALEEYDDDNLEEVARAQERIGALVDDLLTLAREGQQVGDVAEVDVAGLSGTCWRTVETNDATFVTDIDRRIAADESRLQQLLENLFRNAIEHGGDDVTVTVGELEEGFYVEDDGPGIPPEKREEVFDTGYSTSAEGTGFGLSIVEQVAKAHGWTTAVTDGTEGGARIEFTGVEFADD